jgi:hypothetical protein
MEEKRFSCHGDVEDSQTQAAMNSITEKQYNSIVHVQYDT